MVLTYRATFDIAIVALRSVSRIENSSQNGDVRLHTRWNFDVCAVTASNGVCSGSIESIFTNRKYYRWMAQMNAILAKRTIDLRGEMVLIKYCFTEKKTRHPDFVKRHLAQSARIKLGELNNTWCGCCFSVSWNYPCFDKGARLVLTVWGTRDFLLCTSYHYSHSWMW